MFLNITAMELNVEPIIFFLIIFHSLISLYDKTFNSLLGTESYLELGQTMELLP